MDEGVVVRSKDVGNAKDELAVLDLRKKKRKKGRRKKVCEQWETKQRAQGEGMAMESMATHIRAKLDLLSCNHSVCTRNKGRGKQKNGGGDQQKAK